MTFTSAGKAPKRVSCDRFDRGWEDDQLLSVGLFDESGDCDPPVPGFCAVGRERTRVAPGDCGGPWLQSINGQLVQVGVTAGESGARSMARVADVAADYPWIAATPDWQAGRPTASCCSDPESSVTTARAGTSNRSLDGLDTTLRSLGSFRTISAATPRSGTSARRLRSTWGPDNVFASYQGRTTAAVWDSADDLGGGRLAVFMDINWVQSQWWDENSSITASEITQNLALFLNDLPVPAPTPDTP